MARRSIVVALVCSVPVTFNSFHILSRATKIYIIDLSASQLLAIHFTNKGLLPYRTDDQSSLLMYFSIDVSGISIPSYKLSAQALCKDIRPTCSTVNTFGSPPVYPNS